MRQVYAPRMLRSGFIGEMDIRLNSCPFYPFSLLYNSLMSSLNLSTDASQTLQRAFGQDLDRAALEALAFEGYRTARLTAGEVARVLGLETSIAAQAWLAQHGVELNYSLDDLHADREALAKYFPDMG